MKIFITLFLYMYIYSYALSESILAPLSNSTYQKFVHSDLISDAEREMIIKRTDDLKLIYPGLSKTAKQSLLFPDILAVLLGVKPAYLRFELDPPTRQLVTELRSFNIEWINEDIYETSDSLIIANSKLLERLKKEGIYLVKKQIMTQSQLSELTSYSPSQAIKELMNMYQLFFFDENSIRMDILSGFMMGYPMPDILYGVNAYYSDIPDDQRKVRTNAYGFFLLSRGGIETLKTLEKWDIILDYAYDVFKKFHDFPRFAHPRVIADYNTFKNITTLDALKQIKGAS